MRPLVVALSLQPLWVAPITKKKTMKNMDFLGKLLDNQPVEWKKLGDEEFFIIENSGRKAVKSEKRIKGETPYYGANNIQDYVQGYTHDGIYVLLAEDGTKSIDNYSVQWAEGKFWANNHVHVLKGTDKVNTRFLFYSLKVINYRPFLSGGDRAKLTKSNLVDIEIPIPPLSVQSRIVEILDKFTSLEAELEAELDCRKRQYIYYRELLLDFSQHNNIQWKKLGEVFYTRNGYTPSKSNPEYWEGGTIPWYRMEDIRENGRILSDALQHITPKGVKGNKLFKADSIILATTATIGEHALITTDALCNQQLTNFEIKEDFKDKLLSKFVFYYFYVIDDWCKKNVNVSSFPSVSVPKLKNLDFPLPPLSE